MEASDKCGPLTKGMAKHLNILALTREQYEKGKRYDTTRWAPQVVGVQYAAGELQRNIFRKNEETETEWKKHSIMDVSCGESKV